MDILVAGILFSRRPDQNGGRRIENDSTKSAALKKAGIKVITIWECDLKKEKVNKTLSRLLKKLWL
jgi:G:T-mismatch repair DNA endonuclease (very short patch repair protein)